MRFRSLASGSAGNATLVEAGPTASPTRLLVDCGPGLRNLEQRLTQAGAPPETLDALFITHEHTDHIGCATALARRHSIPLWMSRGTWQAIGEPPLGELLHFARDQQPIALGPLQLQPLTVPHDAQEPLQLVCLEGSRKLGLLTDLGHITPHVLEQLAGCHALLLEANHDADLLARSSYPAFLKRRVAGPWGHLENRASAQALGQLRHPALHCVVAAHLSERNNHPGLVRACLAAALDWSEQDIQVATQLEGTDWLEV
ncbi:MAG: MBL fold metallo-hydrolase [Curvibacter sp.]|nr:MBL fold metallo-hydrolase [Curvibacter sp.]